MKVISFVNMKGGVGKTTLAVNVAHCLAERHDLTVLVIDVDPQFNATQCLIESEKYKDRFQDGEHTVMDIFEDAPRVSVGTVTGFQICAPAVVEQVKPWKILSRMDLLPGALDLYRLDMRNARVRVRRLTDYIDKLRQIGYYDVVVIDTPPTPSVWMTSALLASDYYVVPVKPEPLSARGIDLLKAVIDQIQRDHGLEIQCAGVVLSIADFDTINFREVERFLDDDDYWKLLKFRYGLPQRTRIARDQECQTLILQSGDHRTTQALINITKELIRRTGITK